MDALFEFLAADWMPAAVVAKLFWLLQIGLVIHVFKTGRPFWWTWVLFSAPILGGLAYLVFEILPSSGSGARAGNGFSVAALKPRSWRIRELRERLEESDIVKTRLALAEELLAAEKPGEAHAVAVESLAGAFRDDPLTLAEVARYKLEAGDHAGALDLLGRVRTQADRRLAVRVAVLRGRALLAAGRAAEAEQPLASVEGSFIGEEPRFHRAEVFWATGRKDEARAAWQAILTQYRKATPTWRRSERRWFRLAKQRLAQKTA